MCDAQMTIASEGCYNRRPHSRVVIVALRRTKDAAIGDMHRGAEPIRVE
jgi:hypothetical protein